jgi:hypothetical protein
VLQIKRDYERTHSVDGKNSKKAMALRWWENLNPDRLRYQMIFTATDTVTADQMQEAMRFAEEVNT